MPHIEDSQSAGRSGSRVTLVHVRATLSERPLSGPRAAARKVVRDTLSQRTGVDTGWVYAYFYDESMNDDCYNPCGGTEGLSAPICGSSREADIIEIRANNLDNLSAYVLFD